MAATMNNAGVLDCLACERRRALLRHLGQGSLCVTELCERMGLKQQAVSHHLTIFKLQNIVRGNRRGKRNYYSLTEEGARALAVIEFAEI